MNRSWIFGDTLANEGRMPTSRHTGNSNMETNMAGYGGQYGMSDGF